MQTNAGYQGIVTAGHKQPGENNFLRELGKITLEICFMNKNNLTGLFFPKDFSFLVFA